MQRMKIVFPKVAYEKLEQTVATAERVEMGRQATLAAWCEIQRSVSDSPVRAQRPAPTSRSLFGNEEEGEVEDLFIPIVTSDR